MITGINWSGLEYDRHADWLRSASSASRTFLGDARLTSTPSRTVTADLAYAPFGESYAQSGNLDMSFTGSYTDTNANLYDFMYREYGIQGRWPSLDLPRYMYKHGAVRIVRIGPLGPGAFNLADPRSLNGYTYVLNNPTSFIDPLGLDCQDTHGNTVPCDSGCPPNESCVKAQFQPIPPAPEDLGLVPSDMPWQPTGVPQIYARTFQITGPRPRLKRPQTQYGCVQTVFDPSCKPPKAPPCPEVFFVATADAAANDPKFPPRESPEDLIKVGGGAWASTYIMEKGLVVPMRSSIVRGILDTTETAATAVALLPVISAEWEGLQQEYRGWRSGSCSTIWTKP